MAAEGKAAVTVAATEAEATVAATEVEETVAAMGVAAKEAVGRLAETVAGRAVEAPVVVEAGPAAGAEVAMEAEVTAATAVAEAEAVVVGNEYEACEDDGRGSFHRCRSCLYHSRRRYQHSTWLKHHRWCKPQRDTSCHRIGLRAVDAKHVLGRSQDDDHDAEAPPWRRWHLQRQLGLLGGGRGTGFPPQRHKPLDYLLVDGHDAGSSA